jgi:hypothetical protein
VSRTWYSILLQSRHVGDEVSLLVRRKSAGYSLQSVKFKLMPLSMLVPTPTYDVPPSYFLYCGLLFQPLSKDYLTTWSNWRKNAPKEYVHFYECGVRAISSVSCVSCACVVRGSACVSCGSHGD